MTHVTPAATERKSELRARLLARRTGMDSQDAAASSRIIQTTLLSLPAWRDAAVVLLYCGVRNEVLTDRLLDAALSGGKTALFPRCRTNCPGEMDLAPVTCSAELVPGQFAIPEPCAERCAVHDLNTHPPDLILLPGLAYDREGYRLGMGGGYYDRILAHPALAATTLIGLAHAFQLLPAPLPREAHDKPVHAVITNEEFLWI